MPYIFWKASLLRYPSRPRLAVAVADRASIALAPALSDVDRGQQGEEGIRLEVFAVLEEESIRQGDESGEGWEEAHDGGRAHEVADEGF